MTDLRLVLRILVELFDLDDRRHCPSLEKNSEFTAFVKEGRIVFRLFDDSHVRFMVALDFDDVLNISQLSLEFLFFLLEVSSFLFDSLYFLF